MTFARVFAGAALLTLCATTAAGTVAGLGPRDGPMDGPRDRDPAAFLQQLAGEWSVVSEAVLGPGQDPIRTESREVARFLGGRWLVAESTATVRGQPSTSILTLGYDAVGERFVGTWISSMQAHLWSHTGHLNEAGDILTLETEGPIMGDPTTSARYREFIEVHGTDGKVIRSQILGPDGEWFEFSRAEYRRQE